MNNNDSSYLSDHWFDKEELNIQDVHKLPLQLQMSMEQKTGCNVLVEFDFLSNTCLKFVWLNFFNFCHIVLSWTSNKLRLLFYYRTIVCPSSPKFWNLKLQNDIATSRN